MRITVSISVSLEQVSKQIDFFLFQIRERKKKKKRLIKSLCVLLSVWEYLQRDNQDFFKEYYKRCELIHQIAKFNELLDQQIDMMQKIRENNLTATAPGT